MKKLVLSICALCFILTGCNTVKGFGKDMQRAGKAIERSAD